MGTGGGSVLKASMAVVIPLLPISEDTPPDQPEVSPSF